jgi:hypothetical protein
MAKLKNFVLLTRGKLDQYKLSESSYAKKKENTNNMWLMHWYDLTSHMDVIFKQVMRSAD